MADAEFKLEIVTPQGVFLSAPVTMVELPGADGQLGVLARHQRLFTALGVGPLVVYRRGGAETYLVAGGFAGIQPEEVVVITVEIDQKIDEAEFAGCCDQMRAMFANSSSAEVIDAALERARHRLHLASASPATEAEETTFFSRRAVVSGSVRKRRRS
jgi:F-type H+-transporting ATPase subunit epsilon